MSCSTCLPARLRRVKRQLRHPETAAQKATAAADDTTRWYDCKDLVVEGKGWTDTKAFYDRLPAKAEGVVTSSVWD